LAANVVLTFARGLKAIIRLTSANIQLTNHMRKLALFMHTSLDGFVAGTNGELDWVKVDQEIFDFVTKRLQHCDTAVYGRTTFDMMEAYWPTAAEQPNATAHDIEHSAWYANIQKVVLSKSLTLTKPNTILIKDHVAARIIDLKQQPGKEIILFGSPTAAHTLMHEDLIDDYWLFVNPILLSKGKPIFKGFQPNTQLKLLKSTTFANGVVCLHYERLLWR
jgi:dihydrofolate reductase